MIDFAPSQILLLLLVGIAAHAAWFALSQRYHPLFVLAVGFLFIAPFAVAKEAASVIVELKYARVYCSYLMAVVTVIMCFTSSRFGAGSLMHLLFFALLLAGSIYSAHPVESFLFKSIGATTFLGGIGLALAVRDLQQFRKGLRLLFFAAVFTAVFFLYQVAAAQGSIARLNAFGLNPNFIGWVSAAGFTLSFYLAVFERSKPLRITCIATAVALVVIVLFTGSRASFMAAVLGAICILAPLVRRPGLLIVVAAILTSSLGYILSNVEIESASRVVSLENTRAQVWAYYLERWRDAPLFGHGTLIELSSHMGRLQWMNAHSMYIQVLCELGIVGALLFLAALLTAIFRALYVFRRVDVQEKWLAFAMLAIALEVGLFEVAPLTGTFSVTLFWGMAVGLLDRLPTWGQEVLAADEMPQWAYSDADAYEPAAQHARFQA